MRLESPNFNVVLVEPEIPNNTGSIGRTCVGTACRLHLVGKLGFDISDKAVRRAGLDYWENLDLIQYKNISELQATVSNPKRVFFFTKKASQTLFDAQFNRGDYFVFGKETAGLDDSLLRENENQCLRIPILGPIRSLNLSNSVSVVVYEGLRQLIASGTIPR